MMKTDNQCQQNDAGDDVGFEICKITGQRVFGHFFCFLRGNPIQQIFVADKHSVESFDNGIGI